MHLLSFDPEQEVHKIVQFLKETLEKQHIQHVVIGLSGGIDSATSFFLLTKTISPQNIYPVHLSYFPGTFLTFAEMVKKQGVPEKNIYDFSIKNAVDASKQTLHISETDQIRSGNIMARMRMIFLYDLAKKHNALVCGTENKSEHYLGYFTRFGDEASDIEPIRHVYKTQVYEIAKALGVPEDIIKKAPSANLWEGQTDEDEFGFSYKEADNVLYYFFEEKLPIEIISKKGFPHAEKIIKRSLQNEYKHNTPYALK